MIVNETTCLPDKVRNGIERMILAGELGPGERLNETTLAALFETSRGPVREAVRALVISGLAEAFPNRGAFVRKVQFTHALDLIDVRAGLARTAGRLIAERATADDAKQLQSMHDEMTAASRCRDVERFHVLNKQFHDHLFKVAGNVKLQEIDRAIRSELQLYLRANVSQPERLHFSNQEHGALLEAVRSGDPSASADAFELHILNGRARLVELLIQHRSDLT